MVRSWRSNEGIGVFTVVASCYRGGYHVEDAFANIIKVFKAPENAVKFQAEVCRKNTMCTLPVSLLIFHGGEWRYSAIPVLRSPCLEVRIGEKVPPCGEVG